MVRRVNLLPSSRLFVTALCVAFCSMASAQSPDSLRLNPIPRGPFRVAQSFAIAPAPTGVASGDLNGDGHPDLVVTRQGSGSVSVLLGNGKGGFSAGVNYPAGTTASNVLVADLNGDGKLDVAVTDSATGSVDVLFGNGDGTLRSAVVYAGIKYPIALAAGHFTAPGKADLAVASSDGLSVLLNDGAGNFSAPVAVPVASQPRALVAADLKSSGHDDLLLANQDGSVTVLVGDGAGHFAAQPAISVGAGPLSSVVATDLNADGHPDVAVAQASSNTVTVLLGHGDGTFQAGSSYTVGNGPARIIAADLTGSGVTDLVSVNQFSNTFSVLVGKGDGTFRPSIDFVAGNLPLALAAGDFNGDGKTDLAIANSLDANLSVPLGRGDGTFIATPSYRADLESRSVAAGDLNGDGRRDLVVANYCGTDSACSSNGTATIFLANTDGTYRPASTIELGAGPRAVALASLHGSGKLDLIALSSADKTLSVLTGNGDGTFGAPQLYNLSASPRAVFVGDFNGDGRPDLAITSDCGQNTCTQPGTLDIWLDRANGSLAESGEYAVGYSPASIAAADLRGTGHLDLVVANTCGDDSTCKSAGSATVFTNDGNAKFTSAGEFNIGNAPSAIAIGNLSGNGLDLAVAQSGSSQVSVFHSNGDATFGAPVAYAVGTAPSALAIADYNGDGRADLAVSNSGSSSVSVLYGSGSGNLQSAVNYAVTANPQSLIAIGTGAAGRPAGIVTANGSAATPMSGGVTPLAGTDPGTGAAGVAITSTALSGTVDGAETITGSVTETNPTSETGSGETNPTGTLEFAIDPSGTGTPPFTPLSDCGAAGSVGLTPSSTDVSTASCTTSLLPQGSPVNVILVYSGDPVFNTSQSADQGETISAAPTSVSVSSPGAGTVDNPVALTATVAPATTPAASSVVPFAGTITFFNGGNAITACTGLAVTNNSVAEDATAVCTTSALTAPSDSITAQYNSGDPNYSASSVSSPLTQVINPVGTTVAVSSISPSSPTVDQAVLITATVTPQGASVVVPFAGTMSFSLDGATISGCTTQAVSPTTGVATCSVSSIGVGSHNLTALYSGDTNYNTSAASPNFPVAIGKAATLTTLSALPTSSTVDQSVTLTAVVSANVNPAPSPANTTAITGSVSFADNATAITNCTAQAVIFSSTTGTATATCTTSALAAGTHSSLAATYLGNSSYSASPASTSATVTVSKAAASASLSSNPSSPALNQSVTYTASITFPTPLTIVPTGTVSFSDNGTPISGCTAQGITVTGTANIYQAACTEPSLAGGSHAIIADYSGDTNYSTVSGNLSLSIASATTTTTVTASPSPSTVNGSVNFTVSVLGGKSTTVGGTATVTADGTTNLGQCTLANWSSTTGIATCTVSSSTLALGSHSISANYSGDSNYGSSSGTLTGGQTVNAASTSLALGSSLNPSVVNQSVIFTATLTFPSGSTALTGTVAFTDNGATIINCGAITPTAAGIAICTDVSLAQSATAHTIKAAFTDSKGNFSSSNATLGGGQTVSAAAGSISLTSSPNPSSYNQPVTFTATVSVPAGGTAPSGSITFTDSVTTAAIPGCSAVGLNANNVALCITSTLANGAHTVTATYSGDSNFTVSSHSVSQTVGAAATSVNISSSANPSVANQSVTFLATVSSSAQGSTPFGGTMLFQDNGTSIPGCTAATVNGTSGQASCSSSTLLVGSDTITAIYSGDTNFAGSSNTLVQKVTASTGSSITLTSSSSVPIEAGVAVTFTATIAPAYSGTIPLSGTMVFTDAYVNQTGSTTIQLCSVPAGTGGFIAVGAGAGVAACKYVLPDGTNNVTASYVSDANFSATPSAAVSQLVQDFALSVSPVPSNSLGVIVTQGTGTTAAPDPYPAQPISVTPTSISGYTGTLALTCTAVPASGAPACNLASGNLSVVTTGTQTSDAITLDATNAQPGTYIFTVTGKDASSASRSFSFAVTVRSASTSLTVTSGATTNNSVTVQFALPANVSLPLAGTTFSCVSVVGPELSGTYTPAQLSLGCTFNPATIPSSTSAQTASVTVTVSTSGVTAMNQPSGRSNSLLVAGVFGIPVFGFLGLLRGRKSTWTIFLRLLAIVAIALAGWQVMGCGGSFSGSTNNTGGKTPPGVYNILVQGTGSNGNTYQAVVKLNVTL
jgi:Bacterial Ig-like domain (group 3)/FG-GAP-like repeat